MRSHRKTRPRRRAPVKTPKADAPPSPAPRSIYTALSLTFSVIALGVSSWAVVESRDATLQARRAEVREAVRDIVSYTQETVALEMCVLSVKKGYEKDAAEIKVGLEEISRGLDAFRASAEVIQNAGHEELDAIERFAAGGYPLARKQRDNTLALRQILEPEELELFALRCR